MHYPTFKKLKYTSLLLSGFLLLSLVTTQAVFANSNESSEDINANKAMMQAHSQIKKDQANQPLWSETEKKQAELEAKYLEAIAAEPENKKNYAYLAGLYLTNNKNAKAIDAYQDAITHDPENAKLFAAISIAYLHQSKHDMAKAMADQALLLDPEMKGVEKINEYIIAKQEAIKAASKVPAYGAGMSKSHGEIKPNLASGKPNDAIHNPKKSKQ